MKKLIMFLFLTAFILTQSVSAHPTADELYALSTLKKLQLIPEDYDTNGNVTRIDAVSLLLKIGYSDDWDLDPYGNEANELLKNYDDAHLLDADSRRVMAIGTYFQLIKGSSENDQVLLNPEKDLTWREALIFVSRATNNWFEFQNESNNEYLLSTTIKRGFISNDFSAEMLDIPVTRYEWCNLANIVLHIPRTVHSYWGDHTAYYIDNFLYNQPEQ